MFMEAIRRAGQGIVGRARADAHEQLSDQLVAFLGGATIAFSRQRSWASATFSGARHRFILNVPSLRPGILAQLPEHEFTLRGHIVADICLIEYRGLPAGCALEIEALTVEEA